MKRVCCAFLLALFAFFFSGCGLVVDSMFIDALECHYGIRCKEKTAPLHEHPPQIQAL